ARTPDQEQMAPEPAVDDPPSIVQQNTPSEFGFFRLTVWMALLPPPHRVTAPSIPNRFRRL
ncbi:MAG: hypothetical protein KGO02_15305, partial [Alphaproteobacteria bacterium]|nr:hypothetical protein [Alphaproteobacteria bacterium]